MDSARSIADVAWRILNVLAALPLWVWALGLSISLFTTYLTLYLLAPRPRAPRPSEKQYVTIEADGSTSKPRALPCWYDHFAAEKRVFKKRGDGPFSSTYHIGEGECFMSLVIPAYNEEQRLGDMLTEAVEYLEEQYGPRSRRQNGSANGGVPVKGSLADPRRGWEIILVSDGSKDKTVDTALQFARAHVLGKSSTTIISADTIRVVELEENRGKGGAVTHGMRHARGTYVVFADADGASRFRDLGKLVDDCEKAKDDQGRAVGVGSRAHMVGTEAVVKRSVLRNTLMRAFHFLIWTLTTPRTARIRDTQCGFKLFSRPALPAIVPYMHSEGWIFDVEMLMLAESADVPMVEVPIGWKEVKGSKLNVIKDSIGMAVGLAMLRVCWGIGIYRRD